MQRITDPTAAVSLPAPPPLTGPVGYFQGGVGATRVRYWWLCMLQEELMSLLAAAGVVADTTATVFTQILLSIRTLQCAPVGSASGLKGNAPGATQTANFTATELVVETAIGGQAFKATNLNVAFNGATTGAGGMDTGGMPVSADLSIYAIYNPSTGTSSTLGCAGSLSNGPTYAPSVSHMPAGYTTSALIWAGVTDGSAHIQAFHQFDRRINLAFGTATQVLIGGNATTWTSLSLAAVIPAAARQVYGEMDTSAGTGNFLLASDSGGLFGLSQVGEAAGTHGNFGPMPLITAQTIWHESQSGVTGDCSVSDYEI